MGRKRWQFRLSMRVKLTGAPANSRVAKKSAETAANDHRAGLSTVKIASRLPDSNSAIETRGLECIKGTAPEGCLFTRANGTPVRDFRRTWRKPCAEAGVPGGGLEPSQPFRVCGF